jgi:two-component system sensor kinase FixL
MFGIAGAERVNLNRLLTALHPDDHDIVDGMMRDAVQHGGDYEQEYRVRLPDGRTRWLASCGRVYVAGEAGPPILRGVCTDLTRRKQSEERLRQAVESAPIAIVMVERRGQIVLVNAQTEIIFGYSRHELIGRSIERLVPVRFRSLHAQHRAAFTNKPERRAMGAGRELVGRRKDGTEVPLEIVLNPIDTSDGMTILVTMVDVTLQRETEREEVRRRNEMAHLSRVAVLGELSGSLAHELNQPLTAILSNAQAARRFLARGKFDLKEVQDILRDIIDADKRAGETIQRLRLLFKKGEVQHQSIDVHELVRDVLRLLNSDLISNGIRPQTELASRLPSMFGDRVQMQQVLINLILNASDAMAGIDPVGRNLLIRTENRFSEGVEIAVVDGGCGIPADGLQKVFEPFVTTKSHGMGMGLAVCQTIVTAHGGKLWASRNPERGTTFHVRIPLPAAPVRSPARPVLAGHGTKVS